MLVKSNHFFHLWVAFVESRDACDDSLALERKRAVSVDEGLHLKNKFKYKYKTTKSFHLRQSLEHQQPLCPSSQSSVSNLDRVKNLLGEIFFGLKIF